MDTRGLKKLHKRLKRGRNDAAIKSTFRKKMMWRQLLRDPLKMFSRILKSGREKFWRKFFWGLSSEFTLFNPLGSILVIPFSESDQGALPSQWTVKFDRTHPVQSRFSVHPFGAQPLAFNEEKFFELQMKGGSPMNCGWSGPWCLVKRTIGRGFKSHRVPSSRMSYSFKTINSENWQ